MTNLRRNMCVSADNLLVQVKSVMNTRTKVQNPLFSRGFGLFSFPAAILNPPQSGSFSTNFSTNSSHLYFFIYISHNLFTHLNKCIVLLIVNHMRVVMGR